MLVSRVILTNWRNFREVDVALQPRTYLIGANASGKSNFLDVFRFLRTVAQSEGGGLQKAVRERHGIDKIRSLHARTITEVAIEVWLRAAVSESAPEWRYRLAFKAEGKGKPRVLVTEERVERDGTVLLQRPDTRDRKDPARLTQTHLEQINDNAPFRQIAEFFGETTYLHLIPQLLKFGDEISGRILESDPFGQGLLQRIAREPPRTRDARLRRIAQALAVTVPQFSELRFRQDDVGVPHLEARFRHWREHGAWQREDQFSDGTLRLIGLLWALQDGDGLLLLEEPELSLNDAIVSHVPLLVDRVLRARKRMARQLIVSTHSDNLIAEVNEPSAVLLLEPGENGTSVRLPNAAEAGAMEAGLNAAEVLLPRTRPAGVEQLRLL